MTEQEIKEFIEAGNYKTRDGEVVTDLAYLPSALSEYKLAGVLGGEVELWAVDGSFLRQATGNSNDLDLRKRYSSWVNFYKDINYPHATKEIAIACRGGDCLGTLKIIFEEGEGL